MAHAERFANTEHEIQKVAASLNIDHPYLPAVIISMQDERKKQIAEYEREVRKLKAQLRRADDELIREGRGAEVFADRLRILGISKPGRLRIKEVNGRRLF